MTLDELATEACTRLLSADEIDLLCGLAAEEKKSSTILLKLLTAGTEAGRGNLAYAKALTTPHAPQRRTRAEAIQEKLAERAATSQNGRAAGLHFTLTDHAVERYVERHLSGQSPEEALAILTAEAVTATPLRGRTFSGEQQWIGQSGVLFVMRRDGSKALPVCVTILPREEDKTTGSRAVEFKPSKRSRL